MLVLSRREQERIRLGESIVLTIVRISGERVRVGIEAPPEVSVVRDELPRFPSGACRLADTGT
jgi:carbon storage regulator